MRTLLHTLGKNWRWYPRLAILFWLLSQIVPVTHRVFPQPNQTVDAARSHVCVHTNLIDEVDEWKIQQSLQIVREMGADTIVEFFPWAYIEAEEGVFNWSQADRIVKHAEQQGVQIIARFGLVPGWARPDDTTLNYITNDAFDDFATFASRFAGRYAGRIDHYIIWNEPNLAFEWGFQPPDPARYVEMLQAVYAPIHTANLDAVVLAGALAPTLEPPGSPNGLDDILFLQAMYAADAADYFDALAVHTYGFTKPAENLPAEDVLNFRRAELLFDVMAQYGDADLPVYITESGWNDSPRWTRGVRPSQRVAYTIDAYQWSATNWPQVEQLCLWLLRYPRPQGNYRDNFTLVTPEFQRKPIYYAVQAYAQDTAQAVQAWLPPP